MSLIKLKSLWFKGSMIGIHSAIGNRDKVKVRLINQMAMVVLLMVTIVIFAGLILSIPVNLVDLGMMLMMTLILGLHFKQYFKLARHITCWFFPLSFALSILISGRVVGHTSVFLLCIILAFIQYDGQFRLKFLSIIFIAILGIATSWYLASNFILDPIQENLYDHIISFIGAIVVAFLIVYFYQNGMNESHAEKQELIEILQDKNEELVQTNIELDQFTYIASHDLKTPLINIIAFSDLLKTKITKGNYTDANQHIDLIKTNAERMNNLIADLHEYTIIDNDKNEKKVLVDLNKLLQTVTKNLNGEITKTNAKITSEPLPEYFCDFDKLALVFENLIQNGIKYNTSSEPQVSIWANRDENMIKIFFKDNGIGISERHHERIFEFFKRLHNHQDHEGTGMGLGLSKKIIQKMSGNITVDSALGKGSTFMIELPINEHKST